MLDADGIHAITMQDGWHLLHFASGWMLHRQGSFARRRADGVEIQLPIIPLVYDERGQWSFEASCELRHTWLKENDCIFESLETALACWRQNRE